VSGLPLTCVVDASVGIKLFMPEDFSGDVQDMFLDSFAAPKASLFVPDLFYVECANILWKRTSKGEIAASVAQECVVQLLALDLAPTPTAELAERGLEIALAYGISAYDACYVALAERTNTSLLTADTRLATALKDSPCIVHVLGNG